MGRLPRFLALTLAALLAGCAGLPEPPAEFKQLARLPEAVQTSAKSVGLPLGADPPPVRLLVRPLEATGIVRTPEILVATLTDAEGRPSTGRRVEWLLQGAGTLLNVDGSASPAGQGHLLGNQAAVSFTAANDQKLTLAPGQPEMIIHPGQTWCLVGSTVEGDGRLTVRSPAATEGSAEASAGRVVVQRHWIDAEWRLPVPASGARGGKVDLATAVVRTTDRRPLAGYSVRYRLLDGPPAGFLPEHGREAIVVCDGQGEARVTLAQSASAAGVNALQVEVLRPAGESGDVVVGSGRTSVTWQGPALSVALAAPPAAAKGQEIPCTLVVRNGGAGSTRALTLRADVPAGLTLVRSTPAAKRDGSVLAWTLDALPGGGKATVQAVFQAEHVGRFRHHAAVHAEDGASDEQEAATEVTAPQLRVSQVAPAGGVLGAPLTYQVVVRNIGTGPAANVLLKAEFDAALEHETRANPVEMPLGTLEGGGTRTVNLVLTPRRGGDLVNRLTVSADGGLTDGSQHVVQVREAQLTASVAGPALRYVGRPAAYEIDVANPGEVPAANVVAQVALPAELVCTSATPEGQVQAGQVTWNLGTLKPREHKVVHLTARCDGRTPRAVVQVTAAAEGGLRVGSETAIEVRGKPAFRLDVVDSCDPVAVGGHTLYTITLANQGTLPGSQLQVVADVPTSLRIVNARGPTAGRVDGQRIVFEPLESLPPGQSAAFTVEVEALHADEARFRAELHEPTLKDPIVVEEPTTIYRPAATLDAPRR